MGKRRKIDETSVAGLTLLAVKNAGAEGATILELSEAASKDKSSVASALINLGRMNLIRAKEMGARNAKFVLTEFGGVPYSGRSSISTSPRPTSEKRRKPAAAKPAATSGTRPVSATIDNLESLIRSGRALYEALHALFGRTSE